MKNEQSIVKVAGLIIPGKYSVWFKTPVGKAAGVVQFRSDGALTGGDTTFAYDGTWSQTGDKFKALLTARRAEPGRSGVFGLDEIDIIVSGFSDDGTST